MSKLLLFLLYLAAYGLFVACAMVAAERRRFTIRGMLIATAAAALTMAILMTLARGSR